MDEDKKATTQKDAVAARDALFKELLEEFLPEILEKLSERKISMLHSLL